VLCAGRPCSRSDRYVRIVAVHRTVCERPPAQARDRVLTLVRGLFAIRDPLDIFGPFGFGHLGLGLVLDDWTAEA
jgi:hypothetical protein